MSSDLYRQVTDRIIQQIEQGTPPPWRRPWADQSPAVPHNFVSKRPYRGINVLLLWEAAAEHSYSNRWATYRQWQQLLGYQVRRGERGTRIYYWRGCDEKQVFEHVVFAAEQCNDENGSPVTPPIHNQRFVNYEPAERIFSETQADIHFGGSRAYYSVENDTIVLPYKQCFEREGCFYSIALHELAHWSGHPQRLNRFSKTPPFGSLAYGTEELVGEIASAMLTAELRIPDIAVETQSASYVAGWLNVLKADSRAIIRASSQASRVADYILSFSKDAPRRKHEAAAHV